MVREINGFVIDEYNVHKLEEKTQGVCPMCSHDRNLRIKKLNVLLMTGIGVLVRVTTAINLFNCIPLNVKAKQKKYTKNLNLLLRHLCLLK